MADRPKYRRKNRPDSRDPSEALSPRPPAAENAPIPPLETREERLARRARQAEADMQSAQDARRAQIEAGRAETVRTTAETGAQAKADARMKAERDAAERRKQADEAARRKARTQAIAEPETAGRAQAADAPITEAAPARGDLPAPSLAHQPEQRGVENAAAPEGHSAAWHRLATFDLDARILERNRIITAARKDPAHTTFDVLRTRLLQALAERGWSRVAITSPTKGCGKTFTAANLAISLSRQENCATMVLDFDMRAPNLHKTLGVKSPGSIGDMLRGKTGVSDHLRRPGANGMNIGRNIAFGFNDVTEDYAAELLQDPVTAQTLKAMTDQLRPDVVIYDMPPALSSDDVIAFRAHYDAVLLVVGGGLTTNTEIKDVERRLGEQTPLLGMVLNKAEGTNPGKYAY